MALLIAITCFGVYRYSGDLLSSGGEESLHDKGDNQAKGLNEENQELRARMSRLQEQLGLVTAERDRLKEDTMQLLYMVDKLQQQSMQSSVGGQNNGVSEKVVRSWLVRISELRKTRVAEIAVPRDEYVKEVNEIIRGLKEDFTRDMFIMGIGYIKTSSRVRSDITAAQKKLDEIITYLRAYGARSDQY